MRQTKIVATLGPKTEAPDVLRELLTAGVDVARLNLSHVNLTELPTTCQRIREAAQAVDRQVAILLDTQGPEVRLGDVREGALSLRAGDGIWVQPGHGDVGDMTVGVSWPGVLGMLTVGDRVRVGDGLDEMRVTRCQEHCAYLEAVGDMVVQSHSKLSLPGRGWPLPILSERDRQALTGGALFDFVAVSLVRCAAHVQEVQEFLRGSTAGILAKIENREAVEHCRSIADTANGIMVARGDLGVDCPWHEVPAMQKDIIWTANAAGIPVITATQMLESMVHEASPTRAEATDVANAVWDGTDAVMLSEETAVGEHPVEAVRAMAEVILTAERHREYFHPLGAFPKTEGAVMAEAAVDIAANVAASAIVTPTQTGRTARLVSRLRPEVPVIALSAQATVLTQAALWRGVIPTAFAAAPGPDTFGAAVEHIVAQGVLKPGDRYVITWGLHLGDATNTVHLGTVPER